MDVNGISVLVTGGASGLGRATAELFSRSGASVVIIDVDDDKGKMVASENHCLYRHADVTDTGAVLDAVDDARQRAPLRVLVNTAGIGSATRTIGRDGQYDSAHDLEAFRRVMEVNLLGTFNCVRLAATAMSTTEPTPTGERGLILTVASVAAFEGQVGQVAYSASKAGIAGMTLPLARDLSVVGVRVNCIAPGLFDTPMYGTGEAALRLKQKLSEGVLFPRRFGSPSEFASLALEVARNAYINGAVLRVDGGIRLPPK